MVQNLEPVWIGEVGCRNGRSDMVERVSMELMCPSSNEALFSRNRV